MHVIFFDLDGTLLKSRVSFLAVFDRVLRELGLERSMSEVEAALDATLQWYEENVGRHQGDELSFWLLFNTRVCAALQVGERAQAAGLAVTQEFREMGPPALYDDVLPCLDALAAAGHPLGVITARPDAMRVIAPLGIRPRFRWLVDAFRAGSAKQDQRAFRFALSLAGIPGRQAVHVGDQYDRDVVPARAAGMTAVLVDRDSRYPDADCPRVTTLSELPGELARLFSRDSPSRD